MGDSYRLFISEGFEQSLFTQGIWCVDEPHFGETVQTDACHPDIQDVRASFDILGKPKMLPLLMENFLGG